MFGFRQSSSLQSIERHHSRIRGIDLCASTDTLMNEIDAAKRHVVFACCASPRLESRRYHSVYSRIKVWNAARWHYNEVRRNRNPSTRNGSVSQFSFASQFLSKSMGICFFIPLRLRLYIVRIRSDSAGKVTDKLRNQCWVLDWYRT